MIRTQFDQINNILAAWNPIGVPEMIAQVEYQAYVPEIIRHIHRPAELREVLEDILVNKIGLPFDARNPDHKQDLDVVIKSLVKLSHANG